MFHRSFRDKQIKYCNLSGKPNDSDVKAILLGTSFREKSDRSTRQ